MEFNPVIEYQDTISPLSEGSWNFRLCSAVDTFYIRQVTYHNPSCSQKVVTLFGLSSLWFSGVLEYVSILENYSNVPFNSGAKINFTQEASSVFHCLITRIWQLFPMSWSIISLPSQESITTVLYSLLLIDLPANHLPGIPFIPCMSPGT